jgi:hypothetical protein
MNFNECKICYNYLFKKTSTLTNCCEKLIHKECFKECNNCPFCEKKTSLFLNYYYSRLIILQKLCIILLCKVKVLINNITIINNTQSN